MCGFSRCLEPSEEVWTARSRRTRSVRSDEPSNCLSSAQLLSSRCAYDAHCSWSTSASWWASVRRGSDRRSWRAVPGREPHLRTSAGRCGSDTHASYSGDWLHRSLPFDSRSTPQSPTSLRVAPARRTNTYTHQSGRPRMRLDTRTIGRLDTLRDRTSPVTGSNTHIFFYIVCPRVLYIITETDRQISVSVA